MAKAETIVRVSRADAKFLNGIRDRYSLASVAAVVEILVDTYGADFEGHLRLTFRPSERSDDRPA